MSRKLAGSSSSRRFNLDVAPEKIGGPRHQSGGCAWPPPLLPPCLALFAWHQQSSDACERSRHAPGSVVRTFSHPLITEVRARGNSGHSNDYARARMHGKARMETSLRALLHRILAVPRPLWRRLRERRTTPAWRAASSGPAPRRAPHSSTHHIPPRSKPGGAPPATSRHMLRHTMWGRWSTTSQRGNVAALVQPCGRPSRELPMSWPATAVPSFGRDPPPAPPRRRVGPA